MIFEQIHKQLFDSEVLKNKYISEFLNEIKNSYNSLVQKRNTNNNITKFDDLLDKLQCILQDLEEEIDFQYNENDEDMRDEQIHQDLDPKLKEFTGIDDELEENL